MPQLTTHSKFKTGPFFNTLYEICGLKCHTNILNRENSHYDTGNTF